MVELIIVFRECLEASLIIGILYTYLKQTNNHNLLRQMWRGVVYAIFASLFGSILFQLFAGGFSGRAEKLFEGIVMIIASITLATMIIWMAKNQNISTDLRDKVDKSVRSKNNFSLGIFGLAFIAIFREGIETILFLYGVLIKEGNISVFFSVMGGIMGISIGYLIFIQGKKIPIKTFFNISSIILIFVASGMLAYGIHELESAGIITDYGRLWDVNPEQNLDGNYHLLHDKGLIGSFFKGLFGYNGNPSLIEFLSWLFSLITMFAIYANIKKSRSITSSD